MTDFEMLTLLNGYIVSSVMMLMCFVGIVFGFLLVSHWIGDMIKSVMVGIIVALYTMASGFLILLVNRYAIANANLASVIKQAVAEGHSSLGWHPVVREPESTFAGTTVSMTTLMLVTYVGGLAFFFYERRMGKLKADNKQ
jgi:hypothetical protein